MPATTIFDLLRYSPVQATSFGQLICRGANWLVTLGIPIVVIVIAIAGIRFLSSGGDAGKRAAAKDTLVVAIAGLVVLLFAKGFIIVLVNFFGLPRSYC